MGSTGMHIESHQSTKDVVLADISSNYEIVAYAAKRTRGQWTMAHYVACRSKDTGETSCLVVLSHRINLPNVHENLYYKYVDETMGPNEIDAPKQVLDVLTETENANALSWRAACRKNLERAAANAKITKGAHIRFNHELNFGDGVQEQEFTFIERSTFTRKTDGRRVRIPNWRKFSTFEVQPA